MYVELPLPRCSRCGSIKSENFMRSNCKGIRCLDCGHEKKEIPKTINEGQIAAWGNANANIVF